MSKRVRPSVRPGEEWVGGLVTLPSYITGEGEPYRPVAVMWVDAASHFIVDTELVRPDEALVRAAGLFVQATRQPKQGPPHTPRRLRVSDPTFAAALRGSIGEVDLVVAPTPELTEIVRLMSAHLTGRRPDSEDPSFIGSDMTPDDVATMFAAAARLYRAAPWTILPPDACIGVSCDVLGIVDGAMLVVGQGGQAYGFSLFASMERAMAYFGAIDAHRRGEPPVVPEHIMFGYDSREELPVELVREVAHHGWEVAGRAAYPSPTVIDEDRVSRGFTRVEMGGVSAIMTALAELVESEPRLAEAWERGAAALTWNRTVKTPIASVEVELRAPVLLPFDSSIAATEELVDDDGALDEEALDEYAETLLDELGRMPGVDDEHLRCADMLILQAGHAFGVPLLQTTPQVLHQLLFQYIPANVAIERDIAPFVIEAARHLMTLGAESLGIESAKACLASLAAPDLPTRLAGALADASRYSPAKAMIMQGIREGYDLTSERGVAAWVEELSRRAPPRTGKPGAKRKASAPRKPAAKSKPTTSVKRASGSSKTVGAAKPSTTKKPSARSKKPRSTRSK